VEKDKAEDVKDGLPVIIAEPARIQIVETDVVKPRKPSLVHLNTPDSLDLTKTQRRWVTRQSVSQSVTGSPMFGLFQLESPTVIKRDTFISFSCGTEPEQQGSAIILLEPVPLRYAAQAQTASDPDHVQN
jgi:hypothetical protein